MRILSNGAGSFALRATRELGRTALVAPLEVARRAATMLPLTAPLARRSGQALLWLVDDRTSQEPSWDRLSGVDLSLIEVDGFAVLADEDGTGPTTRPCLAALQTGSCDFIGVLMTIADTRRQAFEAAVKDLAIARIHGAPPQNERWIHRVRTRSLWGYDATNILDPHEAEYVRDQLANGDGDEYSEPAWRLAKQPGCDAILLPTSPETLFVFARCLSNEVELVADPPPVIFP